MTILELVYWAAGAIVCYLILAGCARKWGAHTLINGYMDEEKADAVFPEWRPKKDKISQDNQ